MSEETKKLEDLLKVTEQSISQTKEQHRQELQPLELHRRELKANLGELYSGVKPGDVLMDAKGRKVKVSSVFSSYGRSWGMRGINIRKDGSEGEFREIHSYQGFTKINQDVG